MTASDRNEKKSVINEAFFELAKQSNFAKIREYLQKNPYEVNGLLSDNHGAALHVFIANEKQKIACFILDTIHELETKYDESILDLSITDFENKTILLLAIKACQWDVVNMLFEKFRTTIQKIINLPDHTGKTATHYAALYGRPNILQACVDNHADLTIQDKSGLSVLDCTLQNKATIRNSLKTIRIDPDRSCSARRNFILDAPPQDEAVLQFDKKIIDHVRAQVNKLNGAAKIQADALVEEFEKILIPPTNRILMTKKNLKIMCDYLQMFFSYRESTAYFKKLVLNEKSILDECIEGQAAARSYLLMNMAPGSGRLMQKIIFFESKEDCSASNMTREMRDQLSRALRS